MHPNLHRSISFQRATPSARAVAAPGGENQPVPQVHVELGLHNPVVCSSNSRMTTIPCCRTTDLQQGIDHLAGATTDHPGVGPRGVSREGYPTLGRSPLAVIGGVAKD
jgi:hypothetical protein